MNITSNLYIDEKIFIIRGMQVMLDRDLAELYAVETKRLNEQVKRNAERFPNDFMFQLSEKEKNELVANCDRFENMKHSSSNPYVFTEQGGYMLATVLKSKIAVEVNISIMRTFTKLKNLSVPYFDIIKRLEALETDNNQTQELLNKVVQVVSSMQSLQDEAKEETKKMGFICE